MANLLEMHGVCRRVSESFSLSDVSLAVAGGEVVGFVGANGAGKTTTIRAALGLVRVDSGSIGLFGMPFGADADDAAQRDVRSRVGVVLDSCPFPRDHTVSQVAACVACVYPLWDQARFDALVAQAGIDPKTRVRDLSRGMGMKLQLAMALSHGAELLVLDEATAGLDPIARDEVLDMLRAFASEGADGEGSEHAVLLSSHITSDLERIADYITLIHQGKVLLSKNKDELIYGYGIARADRQTLAAVDSSLVEAIQDGPYGSQALINDRVRFEREYPDILLDRLNLDEMMVMLCLSEAHRQ